MTFDALEITTPVRQAINELGFTEPTPVQEKAIPEGIKGHDLLAAAQTGTGKTLAYLLPIFDQMVSFYGSKRPSKNNGPYALVLAPTRELAQQITETAEVFAKHTNFRTLTVIGGKKYNTQIKKLKSGCDVLIATPGRLLDLLNQQAVKLNAVHYLVLDEVDRMVDMGFWPTVNSIVRQTPKKRQTFFFSATLTPDVRSKGTLLQNNPTEIVIAHKGETADTVEEYVLPVSARQKQELLVALLEEKGGTRIIVFTPTKIEADSCARRLNKAGIKSDSIHSDKTQSKRDRALRDFRNSKIDVLVATDVLARGIDITDVAYVVNYTVPATPEDYIHRIGRTGRAGEHGSAYTFLSPDQILELREIEYHTKNLLETYDVPGFEYADDRLVPNPKRPTKRTSMGGRGRRRPRIGRR